MEGDLRYKVEHIGDNLIGMFKSVIGSSKAAAGREETGPEKDLRYKVEHIGDSFAGVLENVSASARASAKGVVLTYDIRQIARKKEKLLSAIGTRVAQISKENPSFSQDEQTREFLEQLDETDKKLGALLEARQNLLNPTKSGCCSADTATQTTTVAQAQSA